MPRDRPVSGGRTRGFSLVELLIVIAACGVLMAVSIPLALTYHQSAQVTAGAPSTSGPSSTRRCRFTFPTGFTVTVTANPVFDYLGRALPAATYTITNSTTGSTVTVSVSTSGRVSIP